MDEDTSTGRGMLMYIKNNLHYNILDPHLFTQVCEAQFAQIKVEGGEDLLFISMYRSPNSTEENNNNFNKLISQVNDKHYKHILLAGDMNYPNIDWNLISNKTREMDKEYKFVEAIKDGFLTQHVDRPTRGRGTDRPSLLDLVFSNDEDSVSDIQYDAPLGKSDHCVMKITTNIGAVYAKTTKKRFCYDRGDYDKMRGLLNKDWTSIMDAHEDDVTGMWESLKTAL